MSKASKTPQHNSSPYSHTRHHHGPKRLPPPPVGVRTLQRGGYTQPPSPTSWECTYPHHSNLSLIQQLPPQPSLLPPLSHSPPPIHYTQEHTPALSQQSSTRKRMHWWWWWWWMQWGVPFANPRNPEPGPEHIIIATCAPWSNTHSSPRCDTTGPANHHSPHPHTTSCPTKFYCFRQGTSRRDL